MSYFILVHYPSVQEDDIGESYMAVTVLVVCN